MWKLREIQEKVTNVVMNYTEVEAKVREATNDDAWGPTGQLMQEVAQSTFTYEHFPEVMGMLWKRMLHDKRNWRRIYKSLLLLGYLVRNGSERVVTSAREHIYDLRSLENYSHIDEFGRDQGINVRQRVRDLIEFIQDDEKLREERKKAKKAKDKYIGMSSDSMGFSGKFGGSGSQFDRSGNDLEDSFKSRLPRFDMSRSRSFEDSPEQSNDEDRRSENDDRLEYKDEDAEIHDAKSSKASRVTDNKNSSKGNRKIDLGAAANFGKDQNSSNSSPEKPLNLIDTSPKKEVKNEIDLLADLSISSPNNNVTDSANGDFADFTSFKSAEDSKLDNFADFSTFTSAATTASSTSGTDSLSFLDSNIGSSQPVFQSLPSGLPPLQPVGAVTPLSPTFSASPSPMVSPVGNVYQPVMGTPVGVVPPMSAVPLSARVPAPVLMQTPVGAANVVYPVTFVGNGLYSQPSSLPVMSPTSTTNTHSSLQDFRTSRNTWSDAVGTVNINVDNLTPASKYDKQPAPSMNQLAGPGSLPPPVSPVTSNIMGGMMSPPGGPFQHPVFSSPGNLGIK
ncbi:clathrin interactor 1-like isoform X2 [Argiope bruennichi]|uniref:Clathrin interactor 1 like protein n=1 Tax=Argiope bruennichi TaxID=94029 RepID=A0A8T0E281_ARGBR|nr:clathrin interactor 1-like isoform X2 [Argiope bruennichi]KAF8764369.1 Clathrin interactor 1 like protein [Argiope bruennichi]